MTNNNQKGKGLESLIPKKNNTNLNTEREFVHENKNDHQEVNKGQENKRDNNFSKEEEKDNFNLNKNNQNNRKEAIFQIETDKIKANPFQPRKEYDQEKLQELASSIREVGIIQPLVATKIEKEAENGTKVEYQLVSGERRLRAARLIGMKTVPVIVRRVNGDTNNLSIALIENIQRADLNPIETARAYSKLQDEFGLTQREIATKVGKSRSTVANVLRLLNLPTKIQNILSEGKITESQARNLLSINNPEDQERALKDILENKNPSKTNKRERDKRDNDRDQSSNRENRFWERQLEEKLSVPVKVLKKGEKGKLVIKFFSKDDWRKIVDKFLNT